MSTQAVETAVTALDERLLQPFEAMLRGRLVRPEDPSYDEARQVFNRMIDKRPGLIVRCAGASDVVKAVEFAQANDLVVAVRGGGHNVAGTSTCDGGLVVDFSEMKGIWTDPGAGVVRVEPGVTWGELNDELQTFGLGATGGYVSTTGVPGLTLGGGLGWLMRKHGLACDNLLSADVVTADGRFLRASEAENDDLFWGLRGGGGNFGIVTSFELRVHRAGVVLAGLLVHPRSEATEVLQFFRKYAATAPDELETGILLFTLPSAPFVPEEAQGAPVVGIMLVYAGPPDEGERVVRPLREFRPPLVDLVQPMPYAAAQHMPDVLFPPGLRHYWKSSFLQSLSDEAIETIADRFANVPSPKTLVIIEHGGGAVARIDPDATAFSHRSWEFNFLIFSAWAEAADDQENVGWTRDAWEAMQQFTSDDVYVNFLGVEGEERVRAAYGSAKYERLAALKKQYDPTNFFRLNQNIAPTA